MHKYIFYGQKIVSNIDFGLKQSQFPLSDVTIEVEQVPFRPLELELDDDTEIKRGAYDIDSFIPEVYTSQDSTIFYLNENCYYEITKSVPIKINIYTCGESRVMIETLLSEVFSIALRDYDLHAFHVGCIEENGYRILLFGDGGQGKSTLTTSLCRNGASFLSDDISIVKKDEESGRLMTCGGLESFKLWGSSVEALDLKKGMPLAYAEEKYLYSANDMFDRKLDWKQIDFCVFLDRQEKSINPILKPSKPMESYLMFLKAQMSGFALTSKQWSVVREIANSLNKKPCFYFEYGNDLEKIDEASKYLLKTLCFGDS